MKKNNTVRFCPLCGERAEKRGQLKSGEEVYSCLKRCTSFFLDTEGRLNFLKIPSWTDPCALSHFAKWYTDPEDKVLFILNHDGINLYTGTIITKINPSKHTRVFSSYARVGTVEVRNTSRHDDLMDGFTRVSDQAIDYAEGDFVRIKIRISGETDYHSGQTYTRSYDLVITVDSSTGNFQRDIKNQTTGEMSYYEKYRGL